MAVEAKQSFTGRHLVNVKLSGARSQKDTRHHEIAIEGEPVTYLPGDALGAYARNPPALVDRVLAAVGATGDEPVDASLAPGPTLRDALTDTFNLTTPSRKLFETLIGKGATDLAPLLERANAEAFKNYVSGWDDCHDVLDLLEDHPQARLTAEEFVDALRKNLPRLYSVASSQSAHPGMVHLLVVSVRYTVRGRVREGVCSTWLADRWPLGEPAEMYMQNQQKHFAMPASPDTPLIMVGPGTGLAPFRAFLQERRATGASGRNWLFFGEQHRATEFFYEDEFTRYERDRFLRLDLAFSRDQADKIYVQHRMREHGRDLWAWLEEGAEFFVCGDKDRMATDVDRELLAIAETHGGKTPDQAKEYVDDLRKTKRYKRDVY